MEWEDGRDTNLLTMGRRRQAPWFQLFHELVDLYGERVGGFAGIGYWVTLRRFVNHDETNPWRGHAFPSRRRLCAMGQVGTDKLGDLRDLCVAWGLLDVSVARHRRFVAGQCVGETRRLLYKVNDPLTAEEFAAAVTQGLLPRPAEPPALEDIPDGGSPVPLHAEGGMDPDGSVLERQGLEGMVLDRSVPMDLPGSVGTDLDGTVNRKNHSGSGTRAPARSGDPEQIQNTATSGASGSGTSGSGTRTPAREELDPPGPAVPAAGGPETGEAARPAVPDVAFRSAIPASEPGAGAAPIPERETGGIDLGAVCARYAGITGRGDLTPERVRAAAGERSIDAGYLRRALDWLARRMRAGGVRNPRALFLQALERGWGEEDPPPDGSRHPAKRGGGDGSPVSVPPVAAPQPAHAAEVAEPALDQDLVAVMVQIGVTERVATNLRQWDAGECARQLRWLPYRHAKDPAATLVRAIRDHWDEPAQVADERCAERERQRTRELLAGMDQAQRAAVDPAAQTRGRAALAEMRAMLQAKCGGIPRVPDTADPQPAPPGAQTRQAPPYTAATENVETTSPHEKAPAREGASCTVTPSGITSSPSSISAPDNPPALRPSSGRAASRPQPSLPRSMRREEAHAAFSTLDPSRPHAGSPRAGSATGACFSTSRRRPSPLSPPVRAGPLPRTG